MVQLSRAGCGLTGSWGSILWSCSVAFRGRRNIWWTKTREAPMTWQQCRESMMVRWVGWIAENQLKILLVWVVAECFKVVTVGSALLEETCCFEVKENLKITHVLLACRPVGIPRGRFKHRTRSRRDRNHELYALAAGGSHYDELIAARSVYRWHRCVRFKLTLCRHRNHEVHALAAGGSHYDELLCSPLCIQMCKVQA